MMIRIPLLLSVVTSMVGVCPSFIYLIRFQYNFAIRPRNFHKLKHTNTLCKGNKLTIKVLYIGLFTPAVRHTVKEDFILFGTPIISVKFSSGKDVKYSFRSIKRDAQRLTVRMHGFSFHGTLRTSIMTENLQGKNTWLNP